MISLGQTTNATLEEDWNHPTMQCGSMDGQQCVTTILNKQLTHDVVDHIKTTDSFIENDLECCCKKRMVNNLLLL